MCIVPLRSINPIALFVLFRFWKLQIVGILSGSATPGKTGKGTYLPIAGTFRRSGNDQEDAAIAANLAADEKENAEHVMLVDLARNDMSRNAEHVTVEVFKEIQFYSHVHPLGFKGYRNVKDNTFRYRDGC
jgi:anthranilate synthase component 1